MSTFIVLVDTREENGTIMVLTGNDDRIAQFPSFGKAEEIVLEHPFASHFPVRYVDMDE